MHRNRTTLKVYLRFCCLLSLMILCSFSCFAGKSIDSTALLDSVMHNQQDIRTGSVNAVEKARHLESLARESGARKAELFALINQCMYYDSQIDFTGLKTASTNLFHRAQLYKLPQFQAIAKYFTFEAYLFSNLLDKAFHELNKGMEYLHKAESQGHTVKSIKINYYIAYSNYFLQVNDHKKQIKYIRLTGNIINTLPDGPKKDNYYHLYYSNLAQAYKQAHKLDSASYYALLSNSYQGGGYNSSDISLMNFMIIGEALMQYNQCRKALSYFKEGDKISEPINHINKLHLYDHIINCYEKLDVPDSAQVYQHRRDSLRLIISQSQNSLLHKLVTEEAPNSSKKNLFISFAVVGLFILAILFIRKKASSGQENNGEENTPVTADINPIDEHLKLVKLIEENSPAFMICFEKIYPEFVRKLREINPDITSSEIKFCAMLKLKIPPKDIARFTFISPKTVQNKKYIIRKKLNFSRDEEIYEWFETF